MSQTSHGYPLDTRDPADLPRCPMERLADRFMDVPRPRWLDRCAFRTVDPYCYVNLIAHLHDPDQIDDLIAYLETVKKGMK